MRIGGRNYMNYFQVASISLGVFIIVVRSLMHIIPKKWNTFELEYMYKKDRPRWVFLAGFISIIFVGYTWYQEIVTKIPYSLFFTILISLTMIKTSQVLFNYERFRKFAEYALTKNRKVLLRINITTTIVGLVLIGLGIYVY